MKKDRIKKDKLSSKEVLEYLSWVADSEVLYEVALATYDLKLAIMVAETTQKDPKEYMPYIESLRNLGNEIDKKFKICLDTKRFDQAIHILSEGNEEQIQKSFGIIKEKKIFSAGLKAFANQPEHLKTVRNLYAEELIKKKEFKQAAPYLLANGQFKEVLDCYKQTLDWEAGLKIIPAEDKAARDGFLADMLDRYKDRNNFSEAGKILQAMSECKKEELVDLLVEKGEDFRALQKLPLQAHNEEDAKLVQEVVKPKLELQAEIMLTNYSKKMDEIAGWKTRLETVQTMKKENKFFVMAEKGGKFDNVSEMSYDSKGTSGVSVVTGASTVSKKMKKPKNLSKRKIQENSPFEEEYLVEKLNETKLEDKEIKEISYLADCLLVYGFVDKTRELIELVKK